MAAARAAAEAQDYERAAWILESRRLALESHALLSSDRRTQALVAELRGGCRSARSPPRGTTSPDAPICCPA
jgi:hypothetical protein